MYPGLHAEARADQPAVIMAELGETVTYRELEARSNQLAHLLRAVGLNRGDHYAVFMENHPRYIECCAAGERSGLYLTCINSFLNAGEVAYIVNNSLARVLITSQAKRDIAVAALADCPAVELCLIVDGPGEGERVRNLIEAARRFSDNPDRRRDARLVHALFLGHDRPSEGGAPAAARSAARATPSADRCPREDLAISRGTGLSLAGASLPFRAIGWRLHNDPFRRNGHRHGAFRRGAVPRLVEKHGVTHTQLVPTMFSRMLKLPEDVRRAYDLSSLEVALHAAAPCPVPVKQAMIDWWGPIILEYYGATEGLGFTSCDSAEALAHPGTIGKAVFGELHVLDEGMREVPTGAIGKLWFKTVSPFEYFNDPAKTAEANSPDRTMSTVGDIGYVDEEGYVYLTDRAAFMIISGGVNIYPQECENLLVTHPKVADAAVFGVPNEEMGEEVKAVVQLMPGFAPGPEVEAELIAFCREHLAHQKCPRSIDFEAQLPRLPTGKLYKAPLRERYWKGRQSRIV